VSGLADCHVGVEGGRGGERKRSGGDGNRRLWTREGHGGVVSGGKVGLAQVGWEASESREGCKR
jgi:hypothetical protein